ncbi:thialysine N-epsilon-acetyltransferase-like [Amphiura filiformis]|uniref:thialysine N-epsilon-acetyltransferase-like n=1 Tax=Amphiura filiformis TaxID=82378 RepID=UPI003B211859
MNEQTTDDSTMSHKYVIRSATQEDCEAIHRLITELARFEKGEDQVANTVQGLKEDGFGDSAFFKCLVAETIPENTQNDLPNSKGKHGDKEVIGYALYFFGYSTWNGKLVYLEDLYVTPDHRDAGLGTAMMKRVARIGADTGCNRMQWAVLGWNTDARRLYKRLGAQDLTDSEEWHVVTLRKDKFDTFVTDDETSSNNTNSILIV